MTTNAVPILRWSMIALVTLPSWVLLAYQHTHGGVASHRFLARDDMPEISNWWGAVVPPLVAWILTVGMQRRLQALRADATNENHAPRNAAIAFVGAACYGGAMAIGFLTGHQEVSSFLFQSLPVVGVLLPLFRAEYVLGFIAALSLAFGGVLPVVIATGVAIMSFVLHVTVRRGVSRVWAHQAARRG